MYLATIREPDNRINESDSEVAVDEDSEESELRKLIEG